MREEPWTHSTHTPCISGTHRVLLYGRVCWSCVFSHETARAMTATSEGVREVLHGHRGAEQDIFTGVKKKCKYVVIFTNPL